MAYQPPSLVTSPKNLLSALEVVFDGGENQWSVAKFKWEGKPAVGVRWNGGGQGIGTPQSRGIPTWFILPEPLADVVFTFGVAEAAKKYGLAHNPER